MAVVGTRDVSAVGVETFRYALSSVLAVASFCFKQIRSKSIEWLPQILPYEELVYDYGYVVGSVEGKTLKCLCGAATCRGYLF